MSARLFKLLPKKTQEAHRANHDTTNHPVIDNMEAIGGTHIQLNISQPSRTPNSEGIMQIVRFGGFHNDGKDHPAYLTFLRPNPFLPPDIHPGYFHLRYLGLFVALHAHREVGFSGLFWHTATDLVVPPGWTGELTKAFRFNVVQFPNRVALAGNCRYSLGSRRPPIDAATKKKLEKTRAAKRAKAQKKAAAKAAANGTNDAIVMKEAKARKDDGVVYVTPEMINMTCVSPGRMSTLTRNL